MSSFPQFKYSNREVKRSGEVIASQLAWRPDTEEAIRNAFAVANNWRDAHAFPMRSVRCSVIHMIGRAGAVGITSARLKRMPAIRRKLVRIHLSLNQIQDLAGCRAILSSISDVDSVCALMAERGRHEIHKIDDYILNPKADGYRSRHMVFKFKPKDAGQDNFSGKRVELQVRTRLQHAWATAVEAVGLFRGEQLKNHVGSEDWLRLFMLMSGELAEVEECAPPEGCADAATRRAEIRHLAKELDAVSVLETINQGVKGTDYNLAPGYRPSHYLIIYDRKTRTVRVEPKDQAINAVQSYDSAEGLPSVIDTESTNIVLVEVDKIENLKDAYPNYFGDVTMFNSYLKSVAQGVSAIDYARDIQKRAQIKKDIVSDLSWMGRSRFPRPDAMKPKKRT